MVTLENLRCGQKAAIPEAAQPNGVRNVHVFCSMVDGANRPTVMWTVL